MAFSTIANISPRSFASDFVAVKGLVVPAQGSARSLPSNWLALTDTDQSLAAHSFDSIIIMGPGAVRRNDSRILLVRITPTQGLLLINSEKGTTSEDIF
jgi:hypothetical protein